MRPPTDEEASAVVVDRLRIAAAGGGTVIDDVSFEVAAGEILGLVGESGSGKTTLGLSLLRHCRRGLSIENGAIRVGGQDLCSLREDVLRRVRGSLVCYVPQDPATALNPALRIRSQIAECLEDGTADVAATLAGLLADVKLPTDPGFLDAYPHQLSGGQLQRVTIAMAFATRPRLIVMDEPTTGLDVTTQAHVLKTVRQLCAQYRVAVVYVSHDIAVIASIAHRVAVVYAGRIVELGPTEGVLTRSAHPYTRALIRAVPDIEVNRAISGIAGRAPEIGARDRLCSFAPRCQLAISACREAVPPMVLVGPTHTARCLRLDTRERVVDHSVAARPPASKPVTLLAVQGLRAFYGLTEIVHGISFDIIAGECLGVVGESGSGKTTLARCLAGLHDEVSGVMSFRGEALPPGARHRSVAARQRIQYIFQNPYASLNPRRSIGASLRITLGQFGHVGSGEARRRIAAALDQVSLPAASADRYPHQLSGGQRQRAAIARALIAEPELLICDEITSALDVSVQAVLLELLSSLQLQRGLTMLFVTHNLAVVRSIAQRVIVMQSGGIAESGETEWILHEPHSPETRRLLEDAPRFAHRDPPLGDAAGRLITALR